MTHSNKHVAAIPQLALAAVLALGLMTFGCTSTNSAASDQPAEESSQAESEETTAEVTTTDREPEEAPEAASSKKLSKLGITKEQAKKARSFITVFVATHVRSIGEEIAPREMTLEDWASNCLNYVDSTSELADALRNDPESLRSPYGSHDQRVVNATQVSASGEENAVLVTATVEATTQGWDHTSLHKENYLVRFDDSNLVTGVEPRGIQPAA